MVENHGGPEDWESKNREGETPRKMVKVGELFMKEYLEQLEYIFKYVFLY